MQLLCDGGWIHVRSHRERYEPSDRFGLGSRAPAGLTDLRKKFERSVSLVVNRHIELAATGRQATGLPGKHLGPGARLTPSDPSAAGWTTAFRFELERSDGSEAGIGFLEFRPGTRKLVSARFYLGDAA